MSNRETRVAAWWRAQPEERRWLLASVVAWAVLLPVSAWVGDQRGSQWSLLSGPLGAISNVAGTGVVGALLVDRITAVKRRQWLRAHAADVLHWHWVIRGLAADLAVSAYDMLMSAGVDKPVPEHCLRADIERRPRVPGDDDTGVQSVVAEIEDLSWRIGNETSGPLAVARDQVDDLCRGVTRYRMRLLEQRAVDQHLSLLLDDDGHWSGALGDLPDGPDLDPSLVGRLAGALDPAGVSRCLHAAEDIVAVSSRLQGTGMFDRPSVDRAAYDVLRAARGLEVSSGDELERAASGSHAVLSLLGVVMTLRRTLHSATKDLVALVGRYAPETPLQAAFMALVQESSDQSWQNWLVLTGRVPPAEDPARQPGAVASDT